MMRYIIVLLISIILSILSLYYFPLAFVFLGFILFAWLAFRKSVLLLLVVGVLLVFQPLLGFLPLPFIGQIDEFLLLFSFLWIFLRNIIKRNRFVRTPIDFFVIGLFLLGIISSLIHRIVPISIALGGALLFFKGFMFFYIFVNTPMEEKDIVLFFKTFLFIGIVIAVYSLLGAFYPEIFLMPLGITNHASYFSMPALQSFLGHPGAFSAFMAILSAFTFAHYWVTGNRKTLFLNMFFVSCMILSFRRTSFAGYLLAVLLAIVATRKKMAILNSHRKTIVFVSLLFFVLFAGTLSKMYTNLYYGYFTGAETPRSLLLKTGTQIAQDYFPLGSGFGTFAGGINRSYYSPLFYKYGLFTVWGLSEEKGDFANDTFWPHVLAETGVFGFLLYVLALLLLLRYALQSINSTMYGNNTAKVFVLGVFMLLILSFVESTKATVYEVTIWAYFYFGAVGIMMSYIKEQIELSQQGAKEQSR